MHTLKYLILSLSALTVFASPSGWAAESSANVADRVDHISLIVNQAQPGVDFMTNELGLGMTYPLEAYPTTSPIYPLSARNAGITLGNINFDITEFVTTPPIPFPNQLLAITATTELSKLQGKIDDLTAGFFEVGYTENRVNAHDPNSLVWKVYNEHLMSLPAGLDHLLWGGVAVDKAHACTALFRVYPDQLKILLGSAQLHRRAANVLGIKGVRNVVLQVQGDLHARQELWNKRLNISHVGLPGAPLLLSSRVKLVSGAVDKVLGVEAVVHNPARLLITHPNLVEQTASGIFVKTRGLLGDFYIKLVQ